MVDVADTVSFRLWPPVAVGLPLVAGGGASLLWGDPVEPGDWRLPVGAVLVLVFMVWNSWALSLFNRHETGLLPGQPSTTMIETGPYRISRNPLYLGMLSLHLGLALVVGSFWALVAFPVSVALLLWGAILPEERFLRARFGPAYDAYAGRVRRWL